MDRGFDLFHSARISLGAATFKGTSVAARCAVPWGSPEDASVPMARLHLETPNAQWSVESTSSAASFEGGEDSLAFSFCVDEGREEAVSCFVEISFDDWTDDAYVLVPGAVYNGNRFRVAKLPYPPLIVDRERMGADFPLTITDVPRLSRREEGGTSRFHLRAGDCSIPAVGLCSRSRGTAMLVLLESDSGRGPNGIEFEEDLPGRKAVLRISSPGVRSGSVYATCDTGARPSDDRPAMLAEGDGIRIELVVQCFPCPDIPTLFQRVRAARKRLRPIASLVHTIPFSRAWAIQEEIYNRERWEEARGYYVSLPVGFMPEIMDYQLGWLGGSICTHALLLEGNGVSRQRSIANLDIVFRRTASASGFLYGAGNSGRYYGDGIWMHAWPYGMHSIRRSGDALFHLVRQIRTLESLDPEWTTPETWKAGLRNLAEAFVSLWERNGQLGQIVEIETGRLLIGGSTAGAIVPAGLVAASAYFNEPRFLSTAEAIGDDYYRNHTLRGLTTGGPIEILQCPDSESAYALVESFVSLYEATGKAEWLERARHAADQFASWCIPYDFVWPEGCEFERLSMHSLGAVMANVQNKHGAPGICTSSGDALLRLFRATGEAAYLELLQETAHNLPQYMSRADRPVHDWDGRALPEGWMCERVNIGDWEGKDRVGGVFRCFCWCEVSNMLSHADLPGVYVQPDTGLVVGLDHVAAWLESGESGWEVDAPAKGMQKVLRIHNPTPYDANVKVFVENSWEMSVGWERARRHRFLRIEVAAGRTAGLPMPIDARRKSE